MMNITEKIDKYLDESRIIDDYVEKFKNKMSGSTYQTAVGWVDGIDGLSSEDKKKLLKKIEKYTK